MGRKANRLLTYIVSGFLSLGSSFLISLPARAIFINFSDPATNELSELNDLGLALSGSGAIDLSTGLGIDDFLVNDGESITFSFPGSLAFSTYTFSALLTSDLDGISGAGTLEAFGQNGSLGIVEIENNHLINVSELFDNQLITKFTFTAALGSGRNISAINYELVPIETPEPSFLLTLSALGLAGIKGLKRKKH